MAGVTRIARMMKMVVVMMTMSEEPMRKIQTM